MVTDATELDMKGNAMIMAHHGNDRNWHAIGLNFVAALVLVATFGMAAADAGADGPLDIAPLWTVSLETYTETGASLADIDGDGFAEILVAGREEMIAVDGDGSVLWRWRTRTRFITYPAVLTRAGQPALIYAAGHSGLFTCLDGLGQVVWQADLAGGSSESAAAVGDLNADGTPEVIQTDGTGVVWAFNALTGDVVWQTKVQGAPASPAVGDLDGDGRQEVAVVTTEGVAVVLDASGEVLWERSIGGSSETWATSAPALFAASEGDVRVVTGSNASAVICFDADGNVLWRRPTRGAIASTLSVGDFDLDGRADIFVITQLGVVYRFDEDGAVLWDIDMQGRTLAAGAILDLDGDGQLEYALSTQDGHLLIFNQAGEFVFDYQFDNRTINVTPAFADVTATSDGLEMVITGGESGRTFCFSTPAPVDTLRQWAAYRGTEKKQGAWLGLAKADAVRMTPTNLAWDQIRVGEDARFLVVNPNPGDEALKATAVCVRPDGARLVATSQVLGKRGELLMPVHAVAPGMYRFSWTLTDASGSEVFAGSREVDLAPFVNDRALATRGLTALGDAASEVEAQLPHSAAALRREAVLLKNETENALPLQEAAPGGGAQAENAALAATAKLNARAGRAVNVAKAVSAAATLGPDATLVGFEATLWENRAVDAQLPQAVENPVQVTRKTTPGQHEPFALGLFNVIDRPVQARVLVEVAEGGPLATVHRSIPVMAAIGEPSWDALPEIDESQTITIPALSTQEVWLDLDCGAIEPGDHAITVRIQALNGAGVIDGVGTPQSVDPPETVFEIGLKVLPFEMAPPGSFRLCAWARLDEPSIADMLAHGNNVFIGPHGVPQYDAQGARTGYDYTDLDAFVQPFLGHDVILLLQGMPAVQGEFGDARYAAELDAYLENLVAHMAGHGIDTDHFALYPMDEPGGHGWRAIDRLVAIGKMVRAVNPDVMLYVDGGGELPMFEAMAPYIDIWCPGVSMLPEQTPEMDIMRTRGKMLWSYDCGYSYARPVGPNIKNINIIAQFRAAALFAFRHGAVGMGYWCYNHGATPWARSKMEYPLVYPGRTKPVTSRRWEAVRESIEDYRVLAALRKRLDETGAEPLSDATRTRVEQLLDVRLPALLDQSFAEMKLGLGRNVIDATNSEAAFNTLHDEMLACVAAVVTDSAR